MIVLTAALPIASPRAHGAAPPRRAFPRFESYESVGGTPFLASKRKCAIGVVSWIRSSGGANLTLGTRRSAGQTAAIDPVWTALRWQGFFGRLCNAGWCGHVSDLFVRHIEPLAIMPSAYQVPTICSHSRCWVEMGSPDPAVSTGLLHQLPFALPKLVSATAAALCF